MMPLRVPIAGLMGLVALFAVEAAALRSGGAGWVDACRVLTVSMLVLATFRARGCRGEAGAFWFGFAVLGWAAFVLMLDPLAVDQGTALSIFSRLPLRALEAAAGDRSIPAGSRGYVAYLPLQTLQRIHILQMIIVPPIGLAGGFACRAIERRRRQSAGSCE